MATSLPALVHMAALRQGGERAQETAERPVMKDQTPHEVRKPADSSPGVGWLKIYPP